MAEDRGSTFEPSTKTLTPPHDLAYQKRVYSPARIRYPMMRVDWTEPRRVDACPTGAFRFGDQEDPDIKELFAKAEPLKPGLAVKPRVYYIGLPKPFIAGAVFEPEVDECTEGARVTAVKAGNGKLCETATDSYGDFWLRDVEPGEYTVLIENDGYLPQKMGSVDATADINVGDIAVWKA